LKAYLGRVVGSMEESLRSRQCRMVERRWRHLFRCGLDFDGATFRGQEAHFRVVEGVFVIVVQHELADVLILGVGQCLFWDKMGESA